MSNENNGTASGDALKTIESDIAAGLSAVRAALAGDPSVILTKMIAEQVKEAVSKSMQADKGIHPGTQLPAGMHWQNLTPEDRESLVSKSKKSGLPTGMRLQNMTPEDRESLGKGSALEREIEQARKALRDAARGEILNEIKPTVKDGIREVKHEHEAAVKAVHSAATSAGQEIDKKAHHGETEILKTAGEMLDIIRREKAGCKCNDPFWAPHRINISK